MIRVGNLVQGLSLPEGTRWNGDRLWLSDVFNFRVLEVSSSGNVEVKASFDHDRPLGLGFLADATPLVALTNTRRVVKIMDKGFVLHADLSQFTDVLNDMVSGPDGRTYVGTGSGSSPSDSFSILLVNPGGQASIAASGIPRANGLAISLDQRQLIYAATDEKTIMKMEIRGDGSLSNPSVFADLGEVVPDGLCLDAEGMVWVAGKDDGFVRVAEGGRVIDRIPVEDGTAIACVLGGSERRTLFMAATKGSHAALAQAARVGKVDNIGFVDFARVEAAGVGWP